MEIDEVNAKFEQLAQLEKEFEAVDLEILRLTTQKQADLFKKRDLVTDSIQGFWPHVLEEASGHIGMDEFVAPEDMVVLTSVTSLRVTRPDVESGDPRNIEISWSFKDNDYMPAQTLVKKFTFQGADTPGLTGLISEPVEIKWKEGKDLTNGVNKAAVEAFEERKEKAMKKKEGKGKAARKLGPKEQKLLDLIPTASSFFTWFSFTGSHAELGEVKGQGEDAEEEQDEDEQGPVEAFHYGDELAVQFAEEVYPSAVKHFTNSLDEDSDGDNNSDDDSVDIDSEVDEQLMKSLASSSKTKLKRNGVEEDGPAKKKAKN